jgi:hypothetical protein
MELEDAFAQMVREGKSKKFLKEDGSQSKFDD